MPNLSRHDLANLKYRSALPQNNAAVQRDVRQGQGEIVLVTVVGEFLTFLTHILRLLRLEVSLHRNIPNIVTYHRLLNASVLLKVS